MKSTIVTLIVIAAAHLATGRAEAQVFVGPGGPTALRPGAYFEPAMYPTGTASGVPYIPPYSYFAAYPNLARDYVGLPGLGCNDFPYYGRPYGHAYDRYSWSNIGGGDLGLSRFYYAPVR